MTLNPLSAAQRGLSLVESLVAFAVTAAGLTALLGVESGLRLHTDLARQRAEAVRFAQQQIEQLRAFSTLDSLRATPASTTTAADTGPTRFTIERRAEASAAPGAWAVQVDVRWQDRHGQASAIALRSMLAALEPALSGKALAQRDPAAAQAPQGRNALIPLMAVDLGNGSSRFVPPGAAGIAWLFDNASGQVTGVCEMADAAGAPAERCMGTNGLAVSGHVRFATGPSAGAEEAAHPGSPALDLDLQLRPLQGEAACFDDAHPGSGQTDVSFNCLVRLMPGQTRWSGRLDVVPVGWSLGHDAQGFRVCRYSADDDGVPGLSNAEHPLDYRKVGASLAHQNFLVVRGDHACPLDAGGGPVNASTVEQAPQPQLAAPA